MESMNILTTQQIEGKIFALRGENVLLDSDVAALYEVETREINQAVKNNPGKFPEGYIIHLDKDEWASLRSKILTSKEEEPVEKFDESLKSKILISNRGGKNIHPKAFTEKGLYMLATILKGERAVQTTIAIVETFAKIKEMSRTIVELSKVPDEEQQKNLMQKGGEIMADLIGSDLATTDTETSFELNFAVMKFKHLVKRKT